MQTCVTIGEAMIIGGATGLVVAAALIGLLYLAAWLALARGYNPTARRVEQAKEAIGEWWHDTATVPCTINDNSDGGTGNVA